MNKLITCTLCLSEISFFYNIKGKDYFICNNCSAVLLHPLHYLKPDDEKKRYLLHQNDVNDLRYQKFVEPIVNGVKKSFYNIHKGLDFGAGSGPVITKLLSDSGYNIALYDPFFWNDPKKLEDCYDFIVCCEVIEHFQNPRKEFNLLRKILKKSGKLFCMTEIYNDNVDFKNWYYKDDPTHIFFYHKQTFEWIKSDNKFNSLSINGRFIELTA